MDKKHPFIITGKSGAGKTHLLKEALTQGLNSYVVDGLTHEGPLVLPNPSTVSSVVFDHVCFLKNGQALIAQAYAWCNDHGFELILVGQVLGEVLALLPAHAPESISIELAKQDGRRTVEIVAHGNRRTIPYEDWAYAMKRFQAEHAHAKGCGPGMLADAGTATAVPGQ